MKLIGSLAIFAGLVAADLDTMMKQMVEMVKSSNASVEGELGAKLRTAQTEREFTGFVQAALQPIYNYGCWCHFGDEWHHAGGRVVDAIDARCKQLINGYRCAKMDGNARNEECNAGKVAYTPYNYLLGNPIDTDCQASNPGDLCAQDACIIEGSFTVEYLPEIVAQTMGSQANPAYQGANGWDRDSECATGIQRNGGQPACCGVHPNRAPYSTARGLHDCCNQNLFSLATQDCCTDPITSDQYVAGVGTCP